MKCWFLPIILTVITFTSYSQLSFSSLEDLNTLCKKEDFEAAKTFLINEGYSIEIFKTNYDHGSYFVLAEIEAKIKVGNYNSTLSKGTEYDNIYDKIKIQFYEYNEKKGLNVQQEISTNQGFNIGYRKLQPIYKWEYENWTNVRINAPALWKEKFPKKYDSIQSRIDSISHLFSKFDSLNPNPNLQVAYEIMTSRDGLNKFELGLHPGGHIRIDGYDYSLNKIDNKLLNNYLSNHNFKEDESFKITFSNDNPKHGDLTDKFIIYSYSQSKERNYFSSNRDDSITSKSYYLQINIATRFIKSENLNRGKEKTISFPLSKKGKSYFINIKFGKILKTYILDSGASDMSIDNETFQYLSNSNQLKIENRLSDAKYQLADGSSVQFKRVRIPSFLINNVTINGVDATIVQNGKPLLLGKSFLDIFKSWKIDNKNQTLIVELF